MTNKLIFALGAILLLISACQVNNGPVAGVINGRSITYSEYMNSFRTEYENFYTLERRAPNPDEKKQIGSLTWLYKTKYVILQDYYKKYAISVTHQEVIDTLSKNPPAYILNSPKFKIDGKFDQTSYLQSLNFDSPQNLKPVRKKYYDDIIPITKLKTKLINNEFLTKPVMKKIGQIIQGSADIDWVIFDASTADLRLNDSYIEEYYTAHPEKYMQDAKLSLQYTLIPASPSETDLILSKAIADSLYESALSGASLEDIANTDTSKDRRIRLSETGFLFIPDLTPEMKAAIYNREAGEILAPINASEGYEIYRVDSVTRSMIKLSRLLIPHSPGDHSINLAEKKARNLIELAGLLGMEKACQEMDYTLCFEENIQPDAQITDDPALDKQLFTAIDKASEGKILPPVFSYQLSSWVVARVAEKTTRSPRPLSVVREQVRKDLIADKKIEFVNQKAKVWLDGFDPAITLESTQDYRVVSSKGFNIKGRIDGKDFSDVYYKAMLAHLNKEKPSLYPLDELYVIPIIRHTYLPAKPNADKTTIRNLYTRNLDADWFEKWMDQQVKKAKTKFFTLGQ